MSDVDADEELDHTLCLRCMILYTYKHTYIHIHTYEHAYIIILALRDGLGCKALGERSRSALLMIMIIMTKITLRTITNVKPCAVSRRGPARSSRRRRYGGGH